MKKLRFFRIASALALTVLVFTSCSKDSLGKSETVSKTIITNNDPVPDPVQTDQTGAIQATIVDGTQGVYMAIYDVKGTLLQEVAADGQGLMLAKQIPVGICTVVIHVVTNNDLGVVQSITVDNVQVLANQSTDLGNFSFQ